MEIDRWAVVCAKQDHQTVQKFIKKFLPTAEKSGMIFLSPPIYVTFNRQEVGEEWPTKFEKFVEKHKNVEFIFLFDDDPENNSHNLLKYYEARHKVLTQHITLRIAQGVVEKEGRNEVLMNILQKANFLFYFCNNFLFIAGTYTFIGFYF
jgi:hypothetical protein